MFNWQHRWDYSSIPQVDVSAQRLAIASIACFCQLATRFLPLARSGVEWSRLYPNDADSTLPAGEYATFVMRGWCRLETLTALCPKKTRSGRWRKGPVQLRYRLHQDPGSSGLGPSLIGAELLDPVCGDFTVGSDRQAVAQIVKMVSARYCEYVSSGSSACSTTIIGGVLPAWMQIAGQPGSILDLEKVSNLPEPVTNMFSTVPQMAGSPDSPLETDGSGKLPPRAGQLSLPAQAGSRRSNIVLDDCDAK